MHGVERFGDRADLVQLDQNRVSDVPIDALLKDGRVRHEDIVTHDLQLLAELARQGLPAIPVLFGHAVFEGHDRITTHEIGPVVDHLVTREHTSLAVEVVSAITIEFTRRGVERNRHVTSRATPRGLNRFDQDLHRGLVVGKVGGEATLIAHRRREPALVQHFL